MARGLWIRLRKAAALIGTALLWFPLLATLLISLAGSIARRAFLLDYLMPAELFPAAVAGAALLAWAAFGARRRRAFVSIGSAATMLFYGLILWIPRVTGLSSGAAAPGGWPWALVISSLALYTVSLIATGVAGILLSEDLFRRKGG